MADLTESGLSGPEAGPADGGAARELVVFLHGWGANGADLFGLVPHFQQALPGAHFAAPNGPETCDMAPPGMESYQWFGLEDRSAAAMLDGAEAARPRLDAYLDAKLDSLGLGPDKLALFGFSQGTMLALHTALRRPQPIAALVGFSGLLIGAETLAQQLSARPPVLLVHGEADEVVPFALMAPAAEAMQAAGVAVETMARPGVGHGIDGPGLNRAIAFLTQHFEGPGASDG